MLISPENHGNPWQTNADGARALGRHEANRRSHAHGDNDDGDKSERYAAKNGDTPTISRTAMSYQAYSAESSMQLQIATKDGDTVTIHIARSYQEQSTALQRAYGGGEFAAAEFSRESSMQVDFTVEGSLSEDEEKSIHQLLQKLNGIVNQFENGNGEQALEHASKIKLDSETLASFSLDMQAREESQTFQIAEASAEPEANDTSPNASIAQQLAALTSFVEQQTPFNNPLASLRTLFDALKQFSTNVTESNPKAIEPDDKVEKTVA